MKKKRLSIIRIFRPLLQIVFFIFLPTLYIEALNGVKQIYLAVIHQSFSAALLPQLIAAIAVIPITIVLGRFFCGWMCGFGFFSDFIYLIFSKVFKKKFKVAEQADKWMKGIKYVVLAVLIVAVWSLNITIFSTASPWDAFGMVATVGKTSDFSYVISNLTVGFVILVGIIVASAFIERFFCRYLCPMGAIFAILSKLRIAKIKKPTDKCGNCRICTNNCAMGIPLYKMDVVTSGECINCMNCITACPRSNTSFTVAKNGVRPLLVSAATVAVMTGVYYTGNFAANTTAMGTAPSSVGQDNTATSSKSTPSESTSSSQVVSSAAPSSSSQAAATSSSNYKNGTYQGSGTGFRGGTTTVSVTIKSDKITDISTVSYGDDAPFYNRAYSGVSQEIISAQSSSVDAVSGATFSSNGIMQAVEDALSKATA